jgi:hypothetical protein
MMAGVPLSSGLRRANVDEQWPARPPGPPETASARISPQPSTEELGGAVPLTRNDDDAVVGEIDARGSAVAGHPAIGPGES